MKPFTKRNVLLTAAVALLASAGCQSASPSTTSSSKASTSRSALVVLHTASRIFTLKADAVATHARLKERVDGFYASGAACQDGDADEDGVPNAEDDANDSGNTSPTDGGVVVAGSEDDDTEAENEGEDGGSRAPRCARCNRGPGKGGDFRFEVSGTEGKLDRGTVLSAVSPELVVKGPNGIIHILTAADTRFDDGVPTAGAEIRVQGGATQVADGWKITATRVKVLCPGPQAVGEGDVPPEATPVDPAGNEGSTPTDPTGGEDAPTEPTDGGTPAGGGA